MKPIVSRSGDTLIIAFSNLEDIVDPEDRELARGFGGFGELMEEMAKCPELQAQARAAAQLYPVGALVQVQNKSFFNLAGEVGVVLFHLGIPPGGIAVMLKSGRCGMYSPSEILTAGVLPLTSPARPHPSIKDYLAPGITQSMDEFTEGRFDGALRMAEELAAQMARTAS